MVAKAEGRGSPVKVRSVGSTGSLNKDVYAPWEMTERERELSTKCVKLIQGRIPNKVCLLRELVQFNYKIKF